MNEHVPRRFTIDGSDDLERSIGELVGEVARAVESAVPSGDLEALILLGGYGRGEGGVAVVDGVEVPHNNLDFLLVAKRRDPTALHRKLDDLLQAIALRRGVGIDLGVVRAGTLRRARSAVMWYDMRHGHATVLGNDRFVPSLRRLTVDRIPRTDVRDLVVNRGTLLVINELILEREDLAVELRKLVVKHAAKAIIGYGDAWLFFAGDYHWSYAEKRARMRRRTDVGEPFRALYDEAMAFRFRPSYEAWLDRDLRAWSAALREQLSGLHRSIEARRLGRPLPRWDGYLAPASTHVIGEEVGSLRATVRKARSALRASPVVTTLGPLARTGLRLAGDHGVLALCFPAVAYDDPGEEFRAQAATLLGATDSRPASLRRRYLQRWGAVGDSNFANVLSRYGIVLS